MQDLGRRVIEDGVFEVVDAVVEVIDGGEVEVDDGVEDEVEEFAWMLIVAIAAPNRAATTVAMVFEWFTVDYSCLTRNGRPNAVQWMPNGF